METIQMSVVEPGSLRIEGYPDTEKVIRLIGPKAQRLGDLSLHRVDLGFALDSLRELNVPGVSEHVRESLWRSAIVHFCKCFGSSQSRFSLDATAIFKTEPPEAMLNFEHFKNIRDRYLVHDENSYTQAVTGALLNSGTKSFKIEKVIASSIFVGTLDQTHTENLQLLVRRTYDWVVSQADQLCAILSVELEALPYQELINRPELAFSVPQEIEELARTRGRDRK